MLSIHDFHEIFERFFPDFPTRDIDDALEREAIERIIDEADIGEDIFDLFAFIELYSSVDTVGDIFADERFFDESRLAICTIEDSKMRVRQSIE
jgi:soluble P-type ATPase